jgi:hypothetical protein
MVWGTANNWVSKKNVSLKLDGAVRVAEKEMQLDYGTEMGHNVNMREARRRNVRFQVLTAARTNMAVFWVVALCNLVEVYRRFIGHYCFSHHERDDGAADTHETSVNFYQTTTRNIPEDSHLHACRRENLKYHQITPRFRF